MATLVRELERHGETIPDRTACVVGDDSRTYSELAVQVRAFAGALIELGLEPGDRISLYLPNCVEYVVCFYGAIRAGMIANPVNGALTAPEVRYLLRDSGAAVLVTTLDRLDHLGVEVGELADLRIICVGSESRVGCERPTQLLERPDAELPFPAGTVPACLPYSSGTTGHPKGIVHTHDSMSTQAVLSANRLQLRAEDVLVQAMPLVHLFGGNIIMGGLVVAGATMVVQSSFDPPAFAALLSSTRATACAGVPTTYALLSQLPAEHLSTLDLGRFDVAISAGAPLASSIRRRFGERYGAQVLDCYGITEAAGNLTGSLRYGETPELSCGLPYPMTEIRIIDPMDRELPVGEVGELIARGPQIMTGYWERPDASKNALRGGWLHTGDLARKDEHGFVYIVDRINDMIISGGYNVYPAEVEEVIQSHPDVALCAVFGVDDPIKGEKPWAAVVLTRTVDTEVLAEYCAERLARYKVPRRFVIVDDIPRSSVGKLLRRELRRQYSSRAEQLADPTPV